MADSQPNAVDAQISNEESPAQLILPETDSGMRIGGWRADRLAYFLPGGGMIVLGAFAASYGLTRLGAILVAVGVFLLILGVFLLRTTAAHMSSIDRLRGRLSMQLRARGLPTDRAGAVDIHGVEQVLDDGSIEMSDGRVVRFARIQGRNTDFQTREEDRTMIDSLRRGIDGSKTASDIDWSIYSMTVSPDDTEITDKYKDVWLSERYDRANSRDVIGYLKSIIDGEPKDSEGWKATEWETYLVVQVPPDEVDTPEIESIDTDSVRRQQQVDAESCLSALREAFNSVAGVTARPISSADHARLVARHWAGTRHPRDFEGVTDGGVSMADVDTDAPEDGAPTEDLPPLNSSTRDRLEATVANAVAGVRDAISSDESHPSPKQRHTERIKEILAAAQWDERPDDDMVVAGDQYCRTYWIADWPVRPKAMFLKELHTMRGIDMSVHHRIDARDKTAVKDELQADTGTIDASIAERKDGSSPLDADVLQDEMDEYVTFFKLLHHTDVQPWEMSSYVTVRAGARRAIEEAERLIDHGYDQEEVTLDIAKRKALDEACEEVEEVLTAAGLTPVTDANRQSELFRSAAPTGQNAYANTSSRAKKRPCATGAIAATFPMCSTTVQHEQGIELGRNPTNGRIIAPDPFETPPAHRLTLGMTGSGKTWGTMKQAVRWYLSNPDRTLVFVDNKSDFGGVTGLLNGETITIGGQTTMNPLRMEPMAPEKVEETRLDPFAAKHRFVTGLILDLISSSDSARDRYRPLLRDGVRKAMIEAGIDPTAPSTHKPANSPTMADVRDAVETIGTNPSAHVRSGFEAEEIEEHVGALLRRLEGFAPTGEYGFLTGESDAAVEPGGVTYLDLQQLEGLGATDFRTTMLSVALGEVYEAVKTAPGETMFVIDEAHHLLKSPRILSWLEESARHWRHNDAGLWFISQHPKDFVVAEDDDEQQNKSVIRDQCQITELFHTGDRDALKEFGLNERQIAFLDDDASKADDEGANHADCLVDHPEVQGWLRAWITVSAAEHSVFSYHPDEHGSYESYIDQNWSRDSHKVKTDGGDR